MIFASPQIRRLAIWWLAVNSAGATVSIFIELYIFYQGVKAGNYQYVRPAGVEIKFTLLWFCLEIVIGALQVLTCCWLISVVKIRNKILQIAFSVTLGLLTGFFFSYFAASVEPLYFIALIGIPVFSLSGIIFGAMTGYSKIKAAQQIHAQQV